jgi:tetratricopeptide (TPR) repeat protein
MVREAEARGPSGRPGSLAAAGILALVCLAACWNSFRAELLLDNQPIILQDPRLRAVAWQNVEDIFTHHYWWPSLESHLYRPLTTLTYWVDYAVLGHRESPAGYHAVNLVLHWVNAVLACSLVRSTTSRPMAALAAAAIFASHPLTVESVTNIVGRADLLAAMSVMGGLLLYRRFQRSWGWRRAASLAGLGAAYLAGVFFKESAVVLPGIMLVHDAAFPRGSAPTGPAGVRQWWAGVWPAYAGMLPGLAALLWARWIMFRDSPLFGQFASDNPIAIAPVWTGVMTAVKVAGYYLALMVWPARLSCDYSYNDVTLVGWTLASGQDPHAWAALAVLAGLAVVAAVAWRRDRAVVFFLGFAAAAFLPTSNLLFPIGTIMAERLMYLPLVGMTAAAVLVAAAAGRRVSDALPERSRRAAGIAAGAAVALVIGALIARTVVRNEDWTSGRRLWSASASAAPGSIKVHRALAALAMASDQSGERADEALAIATRGLRILEADPLPLQHRPAALYGEIAAYQSARARRFAARGEHNQARAALGEAVSMLERAVEIDREINRQGRERLARGGLEPEDIPDVGTPVFYRNLGEAYLLSGDPMRAVDTLAYLRHIQPGSADAHYVLGVAEAAAAEFERFRNRDWQARELLERAAVSLIEAVLLDAGHQLSWQTLERVYGLLTPASPGVLDAGGGPTLNMDHPFVPRHFRQAGAQLVRQLAAAGMRDEAGRWRMRMIDEFGLPPGLFAPVRPGQPGPR